MSTTKPRGRPRGTDYKEDSAALALVAEIMIANPGTRASTAMQQVQRGRQWRGASPKAIVARWLRKWKAEGSTQLHLAHERRNPRPAPQPTHDIFAAAARAQSLFEKYSGPIDRLTRMQKALDIPALRPWIKGYQPLADYTEPSPITKQIELMKKTFDSPAMKAWRERERELTRLMQSPAVQFMRDYMQKVRIAEHAFPPRENFPKKLF